MTQDTKPNIKRTISDTFGTPPGWLLSSLVATGLSFAIIPAVVDDNRTLPDATGTALEESVLDRHLQNFTALKELRTDIDLLKARHALTGGSEELTTLKTAFGEKALNAYKDLYLEGATAEGAAISEQNFEMLRNRFAQEIINPAELGFKSRINAGFLDETLAVTPLNSATDRERFETVREINNTMAEVKDDKLSPNGKAGLAAGGIAFLLLILSATAGIGWEYEPRRVPRRKPKKSFKH